MNLFRPNVIINTLPVTLQNGTTADATQVMSDLNWIVNQVNANAAPVAGVALLAAANTFTMVQSGVNANAPANFPTALQVQNNEFNTLGSIRGTGNSIIASVPLSMTGYTPGQVFTFTPAFPNGAGGVSININAIGSTAVTSNGLTLGSNVLSPQKAAQIRFQGFGSGFDLLNATPQSLPAALSSEIVSGSSGTLYLSPSQTLAAFGFSGLFVSAPQVITAAGTVTIAHTLGRQPTMLQVTLNCLASDINYSPGNTLFINPGTSTLGAADAGISVVADASNITVRYGANANSISILNKTTGVSSFITNANWRAIFRIW